MSSKKERKAIRNKGEKVWNQANLYDSLRGREDRILILIDLYKQTMKSRIESLEKAQSSKDHIKISAIAHEIKGVAANISGERLYEIVSELESVLKNRYEKSIDLLVTQIKMEHINLEKALTDFQVQCEA